MYYSAESRHGSETSHGFANDTVVRVFLHNKNRDRYVRESRNLSCKPITRREVTNQATNESLTQGRHIKPRPFTGEYWGIVQDPQGIAYGVIEVCTPWDPWESERLYK